MGWRDLIGPKAQGHRAEAHDVRPLPTEEGQFDPYFAAICSCGWVDAPLPDEAAARESASAHASFDPELKRPVG
jgi:hypothetical protein